MKKTNLFRVRDIKTDLYFVPSRIILVPRPDEIPIGGRQQKSPIKSNLSKSGKIYKNDPRKHIQFFLDHTIIVSSKKGYGLEPLKRYDIESLVLEVVD